ncbi:hypothetical protein Syun_022076 [Stephania yunnanensis]|uniref:Bet v I/Major latex protein domain-containing protein n=1 Tax=Stephania yunnanensis TaxID=152371 RepID=A0AAP0IGT3_9MAGN
MAELPPHAIDVESEINCPADKMYDLFKNHLTQLPILFPEIFKSAEVLEGDGKSIGSVRHWTYLIHHTSDEVLEVTEKITEVDDENKSLTFSALEGDVLKTYKRFHGKVTVTPKGTGSLVKWHIIYDKENEDDPHPHPYLDIVQGLNKKFEQHHSNNEG